MADPIWITSGRAAKILGISSQAVRDLAKKRRIAHRVLPSGHRRYDLASIERLLQESHVDARPEDAA